MGTKQFGTAILLVLLLLLPASAQSQQAYLTSRTGTLGIRLDGGVSWSQGHVFANEQISPASVVQPQGGVGLFFNFSPSFRLGLDYSYTRMLREQFDSTLTPLPGGGVESEAFLQYFGSEEPSSTERPTDVDSWDQPQGFGLAKLKTCPSGFPKDWPHVNYLRLKDYCAWHAVPNSFFENDDWLDEMEKIFQAAKPMMDFMNAVIDDYE